MATDLLNGVMVTSVACMVQLRVKVVRAPSPVIIVLPGQNLKKKSRTLKPFKSINQLKRIKVIFLLLVGAKLLE